MLVGVGLRLAPAVLASVFVLFDVYGVAQISTGATLDWRWLALAAFMIFFVLVVRDYYGLIRRIQALEDRHATLVIAYEPRHPYWWPVWGYRIGVMNEGPATAEGVEVTLQCIEPMPQLAMNVLPSRLGHKDGYCQGDGCAINKCDEHYYDVVAKSKSKEDGQPGITWHLLTVAHTGQRVDFEPGEEYVFEITASAKNGRRRDKKYVLVKSDEGRNLDVRLAAELLPAASATRQSTA